MRSALTATLLLISTVDASACHHYARWYYPWPQPRCGLEARARPAPRAQMEDDHTWFVEITKVPGDPGDPPERVLGLEKLKELLK